MNQRTFIDRLLSPAGFGLVLLLFLLPFVTVSCATTAGDPPVEANFTFTGLDLLVGGSPEISDTTGAEEAEQASEEDKAIAMEAFDERYGKYYPAQPLALAAAAAIFAGMIVGLALPGVRRAWPSVGLAAAAVVLLSVEVFIIAPGNADEAIADALGDLSGSTRAEADNFLRHSTTPAIGFWLAIVILIGLIAWQAHVAYHGNRAAPPGAMPPGAMPPGAVPPGAVPPSPAPPEAAPPWVPPAGGPMPGAPPSEATPPG